MAHGKKYRSAREKVEGVSGISVSDALAKVKELAFAKFDESVDVSVNLGIDPSKGDQTVRGSVLLPHSVGKKVRVIAFAKGDHAEQAREAGADEVGADDLVEKISGGWMEFDYAVATPDMMGKVSKLAKVLGPKGLLPNKKLGTVAFELGPIVSELKKGRMFFRNDKGGSVHFSVGKVSLDADQLKDNVKAFFKALTAAKPSTSKGKYIQKVSLSSTMGVGVSVSPEDVVS